ncbi:MAG: aldo/keto reductase [Bacillota bacterium]
MNNGAVIPSIGYGTWQNAREDMVLFALQHGYRHIDTAAIYRNEDMVGRALLRSGIKREECFLVSKLWNTRRGYRTALKAFEETLNALQTDYLDMYLIHWPCARGENADDVNRDTWMALEELYGKGKIRAIGVSNFLRKHLAPLLETAKVLPAVNQIEYHPGYAQRDIFLYNSERNILTQAWAPLGSGAVLGLPLLSELGRKYGRSPAQICLRWCVQQGILPLVKSTTPSRILENIEIFDFVLDQDDMAAIDALPETGFSGMHPDTITF